MSSPWGREWTPGPGQHLLVGPAIWLLVHVADQRSALVLTQLRSVCCPSSPLTQTTERWHRSHVLRSKRLGPWSSYHRASPCSSTGRRGSSWAAARAFCRRWAEARGWGAAGFTWIVPWLSCFMCSLASTGPRVEDPKGINVPLVPFKMSPW